MPEAFSADAYASVVNNLVKEIRAMYKFIAESREPSFLVKEIIVLDYMVTMIQLMGILKNRDIAEFHFKSKIQAIVDGESIS